MTFDRKETTMSPLFDTHRLNELGIGLVGQVRRTFDSALADLTRYCPTNSREFSIVKTKLEEACMFAVKSIAVAPENQA